MDRLATAREAADVRDAGLVRRAQSGDRAAFDALVGSRVDRCYRLAWSVLANEADAADATQEGFLAAWRELPRLRDPAAFDGWLNRIVANAARMARRHRGRLREIRIESPVEATSLEPTPIAEPGAPVAPSPLDALAEREEIAHAFDRLTADERLLLVLHYVEDRPLAEIAQVVGAPIGTVKWRLHAARRSLERAMEAER